MEHRHQISAVTDKTDPQASCLHGSEDDDDDDDEPHSNFYFMTYITGARKPIASSNRVIFYIEEDLKQNYRQIF
jgi:hypothetical protein